MSFGFRSFGAAVAVALVTMVGAAEAKPVPVLGPWEGELCGNKWIAADQVGMEMSSTICSDQNSTGSKSPIAAAGWTDGAESEGGSTSNSLFDFLVNTSTGAWSIVNKLGATTLGISFKQGDGFAFYVLDLTKGLSGSYFTGNDAYPSGHGLSHANVWYKGDTPPPSEVPVPAAGLLLVGGLGALAALRRRKAKAA